VWGLFCTASQLHSIIIKIHHGDSALSSQIIIKIHHGDCLVQFDLLVVVTGVPSTGGIVFSNRLDRTEEGSVQLLSV
jgi:hypothetical protein